ncbi:zinc ABC transporter substrate-binding protein [Oceanisphaera profunda]|uniref:High-affinity zinc uptake system protein ZnuA n=1 Tax=Oceanisphaera profunda TaxID=1416627 RepID=A0A1Y0D756_9GAMM|nr:zinc ABC transporter substrate-binding protein ZnuA [Oceanisphaera profunda]ART83037.1 zinc ABC transporter substrate-binding protein [Oceanisphaera profunda]
MKALLLLFVPLLLSSQARAVEVLTSIKPLQLIASAITQGGPEPQLLLPPGSSPHDYALRPSDVRKVKKADLVLWVGPELEVFLTRLLEDQANSLALLSEFNVNVLNTEHDHDHDSEHKHDSAHNHKDADQHEDAHHSHEISDAHNTDKIVVANPDEAESHDHSGQDAHIWLDPHQANNIAELLAARLIELDPNSIDRYQENLATFQARLKKADQKITAQLAPAKGIGYFVFHDAYGHWERHYQLSSLGHFTVNPARAPGAKTVASIHQALKQSQAVCVFAEPQFQPAVVNAVLRNTQARSGILDPLATDITPSPDSYFVFMQQLADAMTGCLLGSADPAR